MTNEAAARRAKRLYWDRAWKLVEGCTKVSPGCDSCWSEAETVMRASHPNMKISTRADDVLVFGENFSGLIGLREDNLDLPLRTKRPTVWAIWNDLFHEDVPDEFRDRAYAVMALCPQHTFLVLTKRAERMEEFWQGWNQRGGTSDRIIELAMSIRPSNVAGALGHVWHGVTAENQEQADVRIPHLLTVPGNRFLSIEPMLGAIDLGGFVPCLEPHNENEVHHYDAPWLEYIHAVLLGGESGKNARPMHPDWVRSVRDQCAADGVPFMFKQWGEWAPVAWPIKEDGTRADITEKAVGDYGGKKVQAECFAGQWMARVGKKAAGCILDGRTHDDLPWDRTMEA